LKQPHQTRIFSHEQALAPAHPRRKSRTRRPHERAVRRGRIFHRCARQSPCRRSAPATGAEGTCEENSRGSEVRGRGSEAIDANTQETAPDTKEIAAASHAIETDNSTIATKSRAIRPNCSSIEIAELKKPLTPERKALTLSKSRNAGTRMPVTAGKSLLRRVSPRFPQGNGFQTSFGATELSPTDSRRPAD